jgi:hypothetical protein
MPSPLKKCWKPGMNEEDSHYLIVIDDSNRCGDNYFFNYLFTRIHEYTYEASSNANILQHHFFWKSIRSFIECKHQQIMNANRDNMRIRLLSSNIYKFACYQEMMFQKIDL